MFAISFAQIHIVSISSHKKEGSFLILILILILLLFFRLNEPPIYILDEAKNAQCAREMLQNENYVVPTFNGALRTDKPPLHYFFMIAAYKLFGVHEWSARFFSGIMGVLTVLITYWFTKKFLSELSALCAAVVLTVSPHFLFEFRLAVPDPYLIFFVTLGLFGAFEWLQNNRTSCLFLSAISLGLATLAKGPVALALPALCVLVWIILQRKWNLIFKWNTLWAFLLFALIALPWYIAVHAATNGAWTEGFFINHNLNRFASRQEGHGGFFLLTLLFFCIGLLPFTIFSAAIIANRNKIFHQNTLVKFSGIVTLIFILFFSFSQTKLPNYAMPCYPFAAVVFGHYIALLLEEKYSFKKYPFYINWFIMVLLPVAGYFAIQQEAATKTISYVAWYLLIAPALFLIFILVKQAKYVRYWLTILCVCFLLFDAIGIWYVYPTLYKQNPVTKTIHIVKAHSVVYAYKIYNPAYNFYLNSNVIQFNDLNNLNKAIKKQPNAIVISREEHIDSLYTLPLKVVAREHDIFELPTTIILQPYE